MAISAILDRIDRITSRDRREPVRIRTFAGLVIRPEVRYDYSLNGTHPFNDSSDRGMFTLALSAIVTR